MRNKEIKENLKDIFSRQEIKINEKHVADTLMLARKEVYQKSRRERISFPCFIGMQIKFIGWKIWGLQGIFLVVICSVLSGPFGKYYLENPRYLIRVLFCLSILVFMNALPFIYRSVRYQIQEMEAASRFSSVKLLMAKLVIVGIGDLFILGGIFFITVVKSVLSVNSVMLYLTLPFLLACSGCLFMLGHLNSKQFILGSIGLCTGLILTFSILCRSYETVFQQTFSGGWIVVCGLLLAVCIHQIRYILYRSPYAELQIA